MTQNVTVAQKRDAVTELVADAINDRIQALRKMSDDHWNEIMNEVFGMGDIMLMNQQVQLAMRNFPMMQKALNVEYNSYVNDYSELTIGTTSVVVPENQDADPFDLTGQLESAIPGGFRRIADMWHARGEQCMFTLPTPLMYVTQKKQDNDNVCTLIDDKASTGWQFDVSDVVPVDCTTQKLFVKTARQISADAQKLMSNINEAIKLCRTDTAVIKVVPELEKYLVGSNDTTSLVASLLEQTKTGTMTA